MTVPSSAGNEAPSILVVDDVPTNVQVLVGMLKERGYRVRAALSGAIALRAARHDPPDLVLLDVTMPDMDGYEVCAQLHGDPRLGDIPVLFISALGETIDKVRAFAVGGVDYITKPFQLEEVEARVRAHLELRRQRRELAERYAQLRELEEQRDSLVHMIVHDLRTPLTTIHGYLNLFLDDKERPIPPELLRGLQACRRSTQVMLGMAEAALDVSRSEAGRMRLALADCDLVAVVAETLVELAPLLADRGVCFAPRPARALARADRVIASRVLQNLLTNSAKHTPSGGKLRVGVEEVAGAVRVTVEDDGPGIPPEYREAIFSKWGQVGAFQQRRSFSTGLGLTFCKLAVEAHGGRIGVDSEVGKGSRFWFELPAAGLAPAPPPA